MDDRRSVSGIVHVPRSGCRWGDCPAEYGPSTTSSTTARAPRSAHGGQTTKVHLLTGVLGRPAVIHLTPGNASDVTAAPDVLAAAPGRRCRKRSIRHDKLAANFAFAGALAAVVAFWC